MWLKKKSYPRSQINGRCGLGPQDNQSPRLGWFVLFFVVIVCLFVCLLHQASDCTSPLFLLNEAPDRTELSGQKEGRKCWPIRKASLSSETSAGAPFESLRAPPRSLLRTSPSVQEAHSMETCSWKGPCKWFSKAKEKLYLEQTSHEYL